MTRALGPNRLTRTRISNGKVEEYTWDHRNRLTKVTFKDSGGGVTKEVYQVYDVLNRWVRRCVEPNAGNEVDTFFSYEDGQIVLQFDDGGTASDLAHRYLWNPDAIDQLLADEAVTSLLAAGDVLWPLADRLGTIRDLAEYDAVTDDATIANHRRYDDYGNLVSETNAAVDEIFGYTGRAFDESTGLQNNLNRWYDGKVGRWLSEDPIGFGGGDDNLYQYVKNSPNTRIDPSGLSPLPIPLPFPVPTPIPIPIPTPIPIPDPFPDIPLEEIIRAILEKHGKYCGKGHPPAEGWEFCAGTNKPKSYPKPGEKRKPEHEIEGPIDAIDEACLHHDCCLNTDERFMSLGAQCSCGVSLCRVAYTPNVCASSPERASCERKRSQIVKLCNTPTDLLKGPIFG